MSFKKKTSKQRKRRSLKRAVNKIKREAELQRRWEENSEEFKARADRRAVSNFFSTL